MHINNRLRTINLLLILFGFLSVQLVLGKQEAGLKNQKILYLNSYTVPYSWSDSITSGILDVSQKRENVNLYIEHLDTKRFGKQHYKSYYNLLKNKYANQAIDIVITSDNSALDFIIEYRDSLIPDVPVVFCGVNNPEDYNLENTNIYGIKESFYIDSVIQLVFKVMPDVKKLYFIGDNTFTSQLNLNKAKSLEGKYKKRVDFEYITNISIDSLHELAPKLEKGGAIVLHNISTDTDGELVNTDLVLIETAKRSSVPIFMDSETTFGKGLLGGMLNSGSAHGREVATLALKFLDNPAFIPEQRVVSAQNNYFFDYNIVKKFNIDPKLLPKESIIINKPESVVVKYLWYFLLALLIILVLIAIIVVLSVNINKRKKAEEIVLQKLDEIQHQNHKLEKVYEKENKINKELEKANENLLLVNRELDIARRKSEESDKLKSSFLANMSHEIRTPLNAIVGFATLSNENLIEESEKETVSKIIESNSNHLLKLIDDILDISKSEAGELRLHYSNISIKSFIAEISTSFSKDFNNPDVDLKFNCLNLNEDVIINTDEVRLRQIFNNLITNASKFTLKGYIEVGCETNQKGEIEFYVKDSGIGIDPALQSKVFERFWKIEKSGDNLNPGTGLGLSISKKICELLGGKMWLESELGLGSTFRFTHPVVVKEEKGTMQEDGSDEENWGHVLNNANVVIVDDNPNNIILLKSILKKYTSNTVAFTDGQQVANYFLENGEADLVLMDIKMPIMDGFEALKIIKEKLPKLPIVAQTAYALDEEIANIVKAGFDDYITKPILTKEILRKIYLILLSAN